MEPECLQNRAKIERNALNSPKSLPDGSQDLFSQKGAQIFSNFWILAGTPQITKNRYFLQKAVPGSAVSSIFATDVFFLYFSIDFKSIFDENSIGKNCFFQAPFTFFPTWRPSRQYVFYRSKCTFHCFLFYLFFEKNMENTSKNLSCQKRRKITSWASQNGPKMVKKSSTPCKKSQE